MSNYFNTPPAPAFGTPVPLADLIGDNSDCFCPDGDCCTPCERPESCAVAFYGNVCHCVINYDPVNSPDPVVGAPAPVEAPKKAMKKEMAEKAKA